MTLLEAVKDITKENPTEEEAMCYARDNFGILAAYIRRKELQRINELNEDIVALNSEVNRCYDLLENTEYRKR